MRRNRSLVLLAACVGSLCVGCARSSETPAADSSSGVALYEANCAACHGAGGLGDGPLAASLPVEPPSLMEHLGHHKEDELIRIIGGGLPPGMPPSALSDDEIRRVVDYAWTLVPDSMVAELREMQRMAEMGMPMESGASKAMDSVMHANHDSM